MPELASPPLRQTWCRRMDTRRPPGQRPRLAPASGKGTSQVRGRSDPAFRRGARRARARLVPGAGEPPSSGARWHRGGSRGREEGGGVGSVRPACSGPEVSPSATCSSGPAARPASGCPGNSCCVRTAAPAGPPPHTWPPRGAPSPSSLSIYPGRPFPWREDWVWSRPEARWREP